MGRQDSEFKLKKYAWRLAAICVWILIWQLASLWIDKDIFLPSPWSVLVTLARLIITWDFWQTVLYSSFRIILGFLLALLAGLVLAVAAYRSAVIRELISPVIAIIKANPVACFVILALLWVSSRRLSVLISFLTVLPIVYATVSQGLHAADRKLLQMARVYHVNWWGRLRAIYIPAVLPHFISAVSVGIGFCWKSGIAAEIIGIPAGSIGKRLYEAKLYLMTKELFAWAAVIITVSILFEKVILHLLRQVQKEDRYSE